jgi:2-(1,2-epoxy-1,2-dihydrophenyl)acetyl-CoA isomerase
MIGPVASRRDGAAAWVTINRPEAANALDRPTKDAILAALEQAAGDPAVRAVALTGTGRAFSAGQDLRELQGVYQSGGVPDFAEELGSFYEPAVRLLTEMPKPTVAVVNGVAAGAGASLALACDLRVAAASARFKLAFSGIGLIPDAGSTWHLPRLVGLSGALRLALLDDTVGAEEAERIGLVSRVWPDEELPDRAAELVARLAAGPTGAHAAAKRLLRASLDVDLPGALAAEAKAQVAVASSSDHAEGVRAFVAKRPPEFTGT